MRRTSTRPFCFLLALAWPCVVAFGQSPNPSSQSQPAGQAAPPSGQQSQSQEATQDKADSVAEAARKAKAKRAAAAPGKVLTEDDLSGMKQSGVSVVGSENKKPASPTPGTTASKEDKKYDPNTEEYWREKARPILDQMKEIDRQIAQLKEEIKKYGPTGFDLTTGLKDNIAYVEDRNAEIRELQKRQATLQKQFEDLEEEGRKAGAPPAWFR